jgi:MFS family permease
MKPVASLYFDKDNARIRLFAIISSIGLLSSFILLLFNLSTLIVFGILLGFTFGFISVVDVAIDKTILKASSNEEERKKNARWMQSGGIFGVIFGSSLYLILITDPVQISVWNQYFLISTIIALPIVPLLFFLKSETHMKEESKEQQIEIINKKSIMLMCIFIFLFYVSKLYEWSFEPWIINKYGKSAFSLYNIFLILFVILELIGIFIASSRVNWINEKVVSISMIIIGIMYFFAPLSNLIMFLILISIAVFFAGFVDVALTALVLRISGKKSVIYQTIGAVGIVSQIIFVSLGTYLSGFISVESLIAFAGIMFAFCAIPTYMIKKQNKESE